MDDISLVTLHRAALMIEYGLFCNEAHQSTPFQLDRAQLTKYVCDWAVYHRRTLNSVMEELRFMENDVPLDFGKDHFNVQWVYEQLAIDASSVSELNVLVAILCKIRMRSVYDVPFRVSEWIRMHPEYVTSRVEDFLRKNKVDFVR